MNKIMDLISKAIKEDNEKKAAELGISVEELEKQQQEENEKYQEEARIRSARHAEEQKEKARIFKEKTIELGKKYNMGIPIDPAEIVMVRYLTERGLGTGTNNKTVIHIRVLEDFSRGRIHRKAGELLCGRKGKFDIHSAYDINAEFSCPRCIEIVNRYKECSE